MGAKRDEQIQRLEEFLTVLHKTKENGVIFSSTVLKRDVMRVIKSFYDGKPCKTVEESMGIKEEIDAAIRSSLTEGAPLFIPLSVQSPPIILTRIETLLEEGHLDVTGAAGREKVAPKEGWYLLAWVDTSSYKDKEFPLTDLFGYKLAL
jgi:hypothetical protein